MGSARPNRAASSVWQKYWVRKSSGKTSDLDATVCGLSQHGARAVEVFARVGRTPHLDQPDRKRSRFEAHVGFTFVATARTDTPSDMVTKP